MCCVDRLRTQITTDVRSRDQTVGTPRLRIEPRAVLIMSIHRMFATLGVCYIGSYRTKIDRGVIMNYKNKLAALVCLFGLMTVFLARAQTAISTDGVVESKSGGFKFPDGTIQATAALAGLSTEAAQIQTGLDLSSGLRWLVTDLSGRPRDFSAGAPTDPDVRNSRIRLLKSSNRWATIHTVNNADRW